MEIRPFQGWRFAGEAGRVDSLIAPPYDVLSPEDKRALLDRDGRNVVGIDLPHCPPPAVGPDAAYAGAARLLSAAKEDGTLVRDAEDCLYAYEQTFTWADQPFRRRTIIAAVALKAFGQGVWPHETTFPGPKLDRMKLRQATRTQLSPIFGFYAGGDAAGELFASLDRSPEAAGTLAGVTGRLWAVSDPGRIDAVRAALSGQDLFIADGHHRYSTAMNYRDSLGEIAPDHPANFVMFVLAAAEDPGLLVLPAHRLIGDLAGFGLDELLERAGADFEFTPVELTAADVADAGRYLAGFGPGAMALAAGAKSVVARLRDPTVMDEVAADHCQGWRGLDVAVLHRLLIDRHLKGFGAEGASIRYLADGPAALSAARSGQAELAVFLQPTPLSAVETVARAGEVMPPKSTYFHPKPATGMVLYPLE